MFSRWPGLLHGLVLAGFTLASGCGPSADESSSRAPPGSAAEEPATGAMASGFGLPSLFASFEAGADADEQLWLLPFEGAPVSAMTFEDKPGSGGARSSFGYPDTLGHISSTAVDSAQHRLITVTREASGGTVRWLNLNTWVWTNLDLPGDHLLRSVQNSLVILSTNGAELTVTATAGAEFQTVAHVSLPAETTAETLKVSHYVFEFGDRLLLGGIGEYESRRAGPWRPLPSRAELLSATSSPDGMRFCAVAVDGSGWLVDADGPHAVTLPFPADHCNFSPGASFATFTGRPGRNELRVTDLEGVAVADFERLYLQTDIDRYSYGTTGKNLVRLDWSTLELETLPSPTGWCVSREEDGTVWHDVQLIGSTAIVEQHCRCTDCHSSGVYALQFSPGASPQPLIAPTEWQFLQISVFPEAYALIARSWRSGASEFEGGDRLLRVDREGSVAELGPFTDLPTPLHAPVAMPVWSR